MILIYRFLSLSFSLFLTFNISAMTINGAGATFPFPIYSKWISEYEKVETNVRFNYQSIGSGGGVRQLLSQTVDFAASDDPLSDKDMEASKQKGWPIQHIPTVIGAVTIAYNLPQLKGDLKLDGQVLANIYLRQITKWNDPQIKALNPELNLPDADIMTVRRADGSGTTAVFSDYLSKVSSNWKAGPGHGKSLRWPNGTIGARGNEGVTAMVKQTVGAIGYIELAYAIQNNLPVAHMKNKAGQYQAPTVAAISMAAANQEFPEDMRISITDAAGDGVYPLSAFTYILLPMKKEDARLLAIKKFLTWTLTEGQNYTADLHYAPLPKTLSETLLKTLGN